MRGLQERGVLFNEFPIIYTYHGISDYINRYLLTSPIDDFVECRLRIARIATSSNIESPVSRLSAPNSTMNVPTPAVHVIGVSPYGTPCRRLTVPNGIPVLVLNAEGHNKYHY